jgi:hypothetical protein
MTKVSGLMFLLEFAIDKCSYTRTVPIYGDNFDVCAGNHFGFKKE